MSGQVVAVDKCSIDKVSAKRPGRVLLTILTITEERQVEGEPLATPTKFEIVMVELSSAIYDILRETQERRFFGDGTINHIHDPASLTKMNKALAELVIECGYITSRQTEKGMQS